MKHKTDILVRAGHRFTLGEYLGLCVLVAINKSLKRIRVVSPAEVETLGSEELAYGFADEYDFDNDNLRLNYTRPLPGLPGNLLGLVLVYLGLYEEASLAWPWLQTLEFRESRGPAATAEKFHIDTITLSKLDNPISMTVLHNFNDLLDNLSILDSDYVHFNMLTAVGSFLLDQLETSSKTDKWVVQNMKLLTCSGLEVLYLMDKCPSGDVERAVNRLILRRFKNIAVSILPDLKGTGMTFFRLPDFVNKVDFSRAVHHADVTFVHSDGFLMKTAKRLTDYVDPEEFIRTIVELSAKN